MFSQILYSHKTNSTKQDGQGLVEYAMILALVSVVAITVLITLGGRVGNTFENITCSIENSCGTEVAMADTSSGDNDTSEAGNTQNTDTSGDANPPPPANNSGGGDNTPPEGNGAVYEDFSDTGSGDSSSSGGSNSSGGSSSSGDTSGGDTSGGDTSGGDTSGGDTSGGDTSGGDTSGGDTSGGDTSGGDTSSGDTSDGDTSSGDTSSGDTSSGDTSSGDTSGGDTSGEENNQTQETVEEDTGCGSLIQEAETATLTGSFIIEDLESASGGQYITMADVGNGRTNYANPNEHSATFCFTITEAGTYNLRGNVWGVNNRADSLWLVAQGQNIRWHLPRNGAFVQDFVNHRNNSRLTELTLPAGDVTIVIYIREDGSRLDNLELVLAE